MPSQAPSPVDVALLCAMPMELRPLVRRLRLRRTRVGDGCVYSGSANGRRVLATATGMGTKLAATRTERLLAAVKVGHVIVFGIAGAVDDGTALGTVIYPRTVIDGATGAAYVPTPAAMPAPPAEATQAAPAATQAAKTTQAAPAPPTAPAPPAEATQAAIPQPTQATAAWPVAHGTIWTTDELITDPEVVSGLRARGVVALDMETAAIADVCERHGLGWSAVRVISDRAADGIVTDEIFRLNKQDGSPDLAAVARYFARHPQHIGQMARLAASARRATAIAADAAIAASNQIQ
jgi:adenosylhomocysteine nucleosidase